jgi:hypothetical protein
MQAGLDVSIFRCSSISATVPADEQSSAKVLTFPFQTNIEQQFGAGRSMNAPPAAILDVVSHSPYSATELKSSANGCKFIVPKQDRFKTGVHNPSAILVEM